MSRLDLGGTQEEKDEAEIRRDPLLQELLGKTPAQINDHINNTVVSMVEVREILQTLTKAIALLSRKI